MKLYGQAIDLLWNKFDLFFSADNLVKPILVEMLKLIFFFVVLTNMKGVDKKKIRRNILTKIDVYNNFISYLEQKECKVPKEETAWLIMPFLPKVEDCLIALKVAEVKLNELYYMLEVFHTDRFGKCADCGKELNEKEMVFMPENSKCPHCDPFKFLHIYS